MHIEWKEKCDKYAIIFTCKLCYKDKLGQTYVYICILSGRKNVILHIFMYNIMSVWVQDELAKEGLRVVMLFVI